MAAPLRATVDAGVSELTDSKPEVDKPRQVFNWYKQWYPVVPVEHLQAKKPYAFQLLDTSMVLWSNSGEQWTCMEDKCPHRLAPLSEGRVDPATGHLMCSYHGWTFNQDGRCMDIPQIADDKAKATACNSPRSCVVTYPTMTFHNILWVWPSGGPEAHIEAHAQLPSGAIKELTPALVPGSNGAPSSPDEVDLDVRWFHRDLPVSYDTLVENLVDPTHIPFAHHGVIGKREMERGSNLKLEGEVGVEGYRCDVHPDVKGTYHYPMEFKAPSLIRYNVGPTSTLLYCVPIKVGWSRIFIGQLVGKGRKLHKHLPPPVRLLIAVTDRLPFLSHLFFSHRTLDGDTYLLHLQERQLKKRPEDWRQYYMPWTTDTPVRALRQWLKQHAGGLKVISPGIADLPPQMLKEQVLDRYHQHTVQCVHCSKALKSTEQMIAISQGVSLVGVSSALVLLLGKGPLVWTIALGLVAIMAAGATLVLEKLKQSFMYTGYDHTAK